MLIVIMPFLSLGMAVTNTILGSALTKAVYPDEVGGIIDQSTLSGLAHSHPSTVRARVGRCSRSASGRRAWRQGC